MKRTMRDTYWTQERVSRLIKWSQKYQGKKNYYEAIAKHFTGKTKNSIYKKLGRLGRVGANWAKSYKV